MPDNMRANNGRGSSYFLDFVCKPVLRLIGKEGELKFWAKHLGNDALAGAWIFGIVGIIGGVGVLFLVYLESTSWLNWLIFWSTIPFSLGSILFIRATYPETMNTSIIFDNFSFSSSIAGTDGTEEINIEESTPLVP